MAAAVIGAGAIVPGLALATLLPVLPSCVLAVGLGFGFLRIAWRALRDPERPRWVVLLLELPLWWQWGAGMFGLSLLPPFGLVALLLAHAGMIAQPLPFTARGAYLAGSMLSLWALAVRRRWVVVRTLEIAIPGLPAAFEGYRIVQLSDLHVGRMDPKRVALRWVRRANRLRADLAVVTGDLVTAGVAHYEDAAEVVAALRAKDGVVATMGNHDQWDNPKLVAALRRREVGVLLNEWRLIERAGDSIVLAGIDDRFAGKADLTRTLAGRPAAAVTVLLSHYPEYFEAAAQRDVALVLSGHTHGGQFAVPFLARWLNLARLTRQRPRGLFARGGSQLYVNAGLGTTGPPLRLGVAPEIALLVLRAHGAAS
jgi:hypothetical protein